VGKSQIEKLEYRYATKMKRKVILSALKRNTKPDFQNISLNIGYTQRLFT